MTRPRVLSTFEYGSLNGGERSWLAVAEEWKKSGTFELVAAAPPDSPLASEVDRLGIPCEPLRLERGRPPDDDALRQQLILIADRWAPALVHANSLSMARRVGRVAGSLPCPTVGHLRDIIGLSRKAAADLSQNRQLFAVSQATRTAHAAQGVDASKIVVVNNGVDLERFQPRRKDSSIRQQLGISADSFILISIGQIGLRKGLDVAIDAIEQLQAKSRQLTWLVVGERSSEKEEAIEFENALRAKAERLGCVRFLGRRDDVPQLLNASDLLLHAARQEPLGRVLLEAAASGLPVVATNVGGTNEILVDRKSGLLFEADDAEQIVSQVGELIDNPQLRERLGAAARKTAEDRFDQRQAAQILGDLMLRLIEPSG